MFRKHVGQQLSAYCGDELPREEARRVAEHLLNCRRCRREYEEIKFGAHLAGQLLQDEAPAGLWEEIEARIAATEAATEFPVQKTRGYGTAAQRERLRLSPSIILAGGCAVLLLLIGFYALRHRQIGPADDRQSQVDRPSWAVTRIAGQPKIGDRQMGEKDRLALGEWLATDDSSRAQISVGEIGEVQVEASSRIQLAQAREEEHRLSLARGKLHAFIWAPPKQFYVDTPSAVAVDLGCSYTLEVGEDGKGLLHVTSGWVAFEWEGRESFVPADAECVTRPGLGPGSPYFSDAPADLKNALSTFETTNDDVTVRSRALGAILAGSRKRDALTLWHLLARTGESERGRVYERLSALIPPPPGVSRDGVVGGDRAMLDAWWDKLELGNTDWWRLWKGPLPSK
jgi:hypothetical protein